MTVRILTRARKYLIRRWDQRHAGFWDKAVAGSSALKAALWRRLADETATLLGAHTCSALTDVEKFYDSLDPCRVIGTMCDKEYPALLLAVTLQVHWAARVLQADKCCGPLLHVTRSILPGCVAANSVARGYVYCILEDMHNTFPRVPTEHYVDDIVSRTEGPVDVVVDRMSDATEALWERLNESGLKVSAKSIVVGSTLGVARRVQQRLADRGKRLQVSRAARDLGVDAAGGHRRSTAVQDLRRSKNASRVARIKVMKHILKGKVKKAATRLWKTGAWPAIAFGLTAQGVSRVSMAKLRGLAMQCTGLDVGGTCRTTAIQLVHGQDVDPAVKLPLEIIMQWIVMVHDDGFDRVRVEAAWSKLLPILDGADRWRHVTGPMGAAMATLLEAQWVPTGPSDWVDRRGERWTLDADSKPTVHTCEPLLGQLRQDLVGSLWFKASGLRNGAGLGKVPDLGQLQRHLRHLARKGQHGMAGMLTQVAVGGLWPRARRQSAGLLDDGSCVLCGSGALQDEYHLAYECPAILQDAEVSAGITECMLREARQQARGNPSFWLRGLSASMSLPKPCGDRFEFVWGEDEGDWSPGRYYTDASGGEHSSDPRLRRVAYGVFRLDRFDMALEQKMVALGGALPGDRQTVNRGELLAVVAALGRIQPVPGVSTVICTDSLYTWRGAFDPEARDDGSNFDLWMALKEQVDRHGGRVEFHKVPAHRTWADVDAGVISELDLVGNMVADLIANTFASGCQVPQQVVSEVAMSDARAWIVQEHLARVMILAVKLQPQLKKTLRQRCKRKKTLSSAMQMGHRLAAQFGGHRCRVCLVWKGQSAKAFWRCNPCQGNPGIVEADRVEAAAVHGPATGTVLFGGKAIHGSHTFGFCRGILWCWKCGAWTQGGRVKNLGQPCNRFPNGPGKTVLRRVERQMTPAVQCEWPLPEGELPPFAIAHLVEQGPPAVPRGKRRPRRPLPS